ncbi:stress response protein nst1-like [Pollicipes pollicipes]|uniref:stress response protein nst1-like n=1 Tax=Pollicipes pollicipes TaxID=41117 RepID=UPI0018857AC1|nr:stress response protein nst1-like [Pollicipes pollicipes]
MTADGSQEGDDHQSREGDDHLNQEYSDRASSGQRSLEDEDDLGEEESEEWTSDEESGDEYQDSQDEMRERQGNIRLQTEICENDSDLLRQMRQAAAYLERHEQGHIVLMAQGAFAAVRRRLSDATLLAAAERTPWLTRTQRLRRLAPYVEPHCGNLMLELSKAFIQLSESEQTRTKAEHSRDKLQRARDVINDSWKQARHNAEKARSEAEKARSRAEQARAEAEAQRSEIESRFASVVEHCSFHHRLFAILSTKLERMSATVAGGQPVTRDELRRLRKVVPSIPPCVIWPRALKRWERDGRCLS